MHYNNAYTFVYLCIMFKMKSTEVQTLQLILCTMPMRVRGNWPRLAL